MLCWVAPWGHALVKGPRKGQISLFYCLLKTHGSDPWVCLLTYMVNSNWHSTPESQDLLALEPLLPFRTSSVAPKATGHLAECRSSMGRRGNHPKCHKPQQFSLGPLLQEMSNAKGSSRGKKMALWRRPAWLQDDWQRTEDEALLKDPKSACHRSHCFPLSHQPWTAIRVRRGSRDQKPPQRLAVSLSLLLALSFIAQLFVSIID